MQMFKRVSTSVVQFTFSPECVVSGGPETPGTPMPQLNSGPHRPLSNLPSQSFSQQFPVLETMDTTILSDLRSSLSTLAGEQSVVDQLFRTVDRLVAAALNPAVSRNELNQAIGQFCLILDVDSKFGSRKVVEFYADLIRNDTDRHADMHDKISSLQKSGCDVTTLSRIMVPLKNDLFGAKQSRKTEPIQTNVEQDLLKISFV